MRRVPGVAVVALAGFLGCAPRLIAGTEVKDTTDNRDLLGAVGAYRAALQAKDVEGLMKLVSPDFFEDSGTSGADDDYDFAGLKERLVRWARQTGSVRADVTVKQVKVEGDVAAVNYFYDLAYQFLPGEGAEPVWKRESDAKQLSLRREGGRWLITRGI